MTMAGTSGQQFDRILGYILEKTGIRLPETKYRALGDYLSDFGDEPDFSAFTRHVEGAGAEDFINTVTINETYFFREQRHFSVLHSGLLATLAERSKPLRIWSAACSSGEEALSLAALAWSLLGEGAARIFASDINTQVLDRLRGGLYGSGSLREDGRGFHQLLEPFLERTGAMLQIRPALLDSITVKVVNLSDPSYPAIPDGLDLVFMRNVLMYMPLETRHRILGTVSDKLAEGGCLFVSSSEIPHLAHPELALRDSDGCYYFQKKGATEKHKGMVVTGDSFKKYERAGIPCVTLTNVPEKTLPETPKEAPRAGLPAGTGLWEAAARFATLRLNNPVFELEGEPAFDAAIHYLEAMYRMNSGNLEGFDAFIRKGEAVWGITPVSAYFRGLAASASQDAGGEAYREALGLDSSFWPARLNLAMVLRSREPKTAIGELKTCIRDIESYIEAQEFQYQFLLEGFNARYFMNLCQGWIRKLQSGGAGHGS
jgi:chemotaxis protein methyltransferase CheR